MPRFTMITALFVALATQAVVASPAEQNPGFFSETPGCLARDMMMMTINATGTSAGTASQCGLPQSQIDAEYQKITAQFQPCFVAEKITLEQWKAEYEAGRKGWLTAPGIQELMSFPESKKSTCDRTREEYPKP